MQPVHTLIRLADPLDHGADPLDVRVPAPLRAAVGVRHRHAPRGVLAAHFTHCCHLRLLSDLGDSPADGRRRNDTSGYRQPGVTPRVASSLRLINDVKGTYHAAPCSTTGRGSILRAPASVAIVTGIAVTVLAVAAAGPSDDDAQAVVDHYADGVHAAYSASLESATALDAAIDAFLADPTDETLEAAKQAWLAARDDYGPTEAFRFYGGPIDNETDGPEGQINAWPLDEAYIDYVEGDDASGHRQRPRHLPDDRRRGAHRRSTRRAARRTSPPAGTPSSSCCGARTCQRTGRAPGRSPTTRPPTTPTAGPRTSP